MEFSELIQTLSIYALPVLFAVTLHEAAHGYAARHFGDDTAWKLGRITLNPTSHIDPVGTLLMPLLLFWATKGAFVFGYAKPVPVRFGNLRNPKRDMVWVALAGPGANLLQTLLWGVLSVVLYSADVREPFFLEMCRAGMLVNAVMFAFNMFPLPPLDGGRILMGLLPIQQALQLSRLEPYGFFIVMALVLTGIIGDFWMRPIVGAVLRGLAALLAG